MNVNLNVCSPELLDGDAGEYTCEASLRSGRYSWRGWLRVSGEGTQRAADAVALPGAPLQPRLNVTERSVTLTWLRNQKVGSSSLLGYQVEMLARPADRDRAPTEPASWTTTARLLPVASYSYTQLAEGMSYMFLVRAQNSHGLSAPSDLAGPVVQDAAGRWLERRSEGDAHQDEDGHVQDALDSAPIVRLNEVAVASPTSVKLLWDVLDPDRVEGLSIYWRSEDDPHLHTLTVMQSGPPHGSPSLGFLVTGLRCFTAYQFFLVPFSSEGEGQPSSSAHIKTPPGGKWNGPLECIPLLKPHLCVSKSNPDIK